ncbi:hypothetical protein WG915_08895 [Corynebacterium sp. H128]|uniref:hypothetical protein n=1 Tax=Corynebacterium sp. H128 TaxID=3133427 RepID=UPI0030999BC2
MTSENDETAQAPQADSEVLAPQGDTSNASNGESDQAKQENHVAEAKKYRKRAQEAEAQLETAQARFNSLARCVIDAEVTRLGIKPAALWATGTTIETLLTEDGGIDYTALQTAVDTTAESLGITRAQPAYSPNQGKGTEPIKTASWGSIFTR